MTKGKRLGNLFGETSFSDCSKRRFLKLSACTQPPWECVEQFNINKGKFCKILCKLVTKK